MTIQFRNEDPPDDDEDAVDGGTGIEPEVIEPERDREYEEFVQQIRELEEKEELNKLAIGELVRQLRVLQEQERLKKLEIEEFIRQSHAQEEQEVEEQWDLLGHVRWGIKGDN